MPNEEPQAVASLARLELSLRRLDQRVRRLSPTRWDARAQDGRPRSDVGYELADLLAALGRQAGSGSPAGPPPRLAPHGIADQLMVLGLDLLNAPTAAATAEAAAVAVEAAAELL